MRAGPALAGLTIAVAAGLLSGRALAAPKIEAASGTPVTFTSTRLDTMIYIAHGDGPSAPDGQPFEKIGVAPVTVRLAPGTYTIETESESTSTGHERIRVDTTPIKMDIRPGDETVKTLGGVFEGIGVTGLVLGVIAALVISPHDQNFPRWAIAIPALLGGATSLGVGIGLSIVGSTTLTLPRASTQGLRLSASFTLRF